jgi:hypothetical protein
VEVKIGVTHSPRELLVSSPQKPEEVEKLVLDALQADTGLLQLVDDRGRRVLVPTARIAYVEITPSDGRRIGFVAS